MHTAPPGVFGAARTLWSLSLAWTCDKYLLREIQVRTETDAGASVSRN